MKRTEAEARPAGAGPWGARAGEAGRWEMDLARFGGGGPLGRGRSGPGGAGGWTAGSWAFAGARASWAGAEAHEEGLVSLDPDRIGEAGAAAPDGEAGEGRRGFPGCGTGSSGDGERRIRRGKARIRRRRGKTGPAGSLVGGGTGEVRRGRSAVETGGGRRTASGRTKAAPPGRRREEMDPRGPVAGFPGPAAKWGDAEAGWDRWRPRVGGERRRG